MQLRGAQILDAVRLFKTGFPESMVYAEFWRKFRTLAPQESEGHGQFHQRSNPGHSEVKSAVEEFLAYLDLDKSTVRLGNTQVRPDFVSEICASPISPIWRETFCSRSLRRDLKCNFSPLNFLSGSLFSQIEISK